MIWIITFVIILYIALIVGLTMLFSSRHGWIMAVIRNGIIVLCIPLAVLCAKPLARVLGKWLLDLLFSSSSSFGQVSTEAPLTEASLQTIMGLFLAPLLFFVFFILIRFLLSLIAMICEKNIPFLREKRSYDRVVSLSVGGVNGLLIALVTLIPLCGTLHLMHRTVDALLEDSFLRSSGAYVQAEAEGVPLQAMGDVAGQLDGLMVTPIAVVGDPLYGWLTSDTVEDGDIRISLCKELPCLGRAAGDLWSVAVRMEEGLSADDRHLLTQAIDSLFASDWIAALGADLLHEAADAWRSGDDFLDVEPLDISALMQPTMQVLYDILADETVQTVRKDVHTMAEVISMLAAEGFLSHDAAHEDLLVSLASSAEGGTDLFGRLLEKVEGNEHLKPLAVELEALAGRVVSTVLADEIRHNDRYAPVIENATGALNQALLLTGEERDEQINKVLQEAFAEEGISIPPGLGAEIAGDILDQYGDDGVIEEHEVKAGLTERIEGDEQAILDILEENDLDAFISSYAMEN